MFTLTDKDSNRLYGFCRRYIASAGTEVACILSRHCWYETMHVVLDAVEETAKGSTGAYGVAALIKAVTSAGLPQPGQLLHVPVKGIHPRLHALSVERPINTSRCSYDRRLCVLFRSLVVSKVPLGVALNPAPCAMHPKPYSLLPTPYSLLPTPYSLLVSMM